MIAKTDLRLGNFVDINNGFYAKVQAIKNKSLSARGIMGVLNFYAYEKVKPIPLTPELLEKCGFVKDKILGQWTHPSDQQGVYIQNGLRVMGKDGIKVNKFEDGFFIETYYSGIEIKYLHQLQNIYYALTGEELTITL